MTTKQAIGVLSCYYYFQSFYAVGEVGPSMESTKIKQILQQLEKHYPDAKYELHWKTPLDLLVATVLAAQCTDERVNQVTPALFAKYPTAKDYAHADAEEIQKMIQSINFYRKKANAIQKICQKLVDDFDGDVPQDIDEMVQLPGVARKTANVVLNNHFRIPSGIIVDSHVVRVSQRLGLTKDSKPEKIEVDLMKKIPKDSWVTFGPALVLLGRYVCQSKNPKCAECCLTKTCPKLGV